MMHERIKGVSVKEVQCDEIWGFIGMKKKTKKRQGRDEENDLGDSYTFVGMERHTKLVLAWQFLGRRNCE